ncbi:hypothetical protein ABIC09_000449, partial [Bradyrhizobium sp. S3.12.5]
QVLAPASPGAGKSWRRQVLAPASPGAGKSWRRQVLAQLPIFG